MLKRKSNQIFYSLLLSFFILGISGCDSQPRMEEIELEMARGEFSIAYEHLSMLAEENYHHAQGLLFEIIFIPDDQYPNVNTLADKPRYTVMQKGQKVMVKDQKMMAQNLLEKAGNNDARINFYKAEITHTLIDNPIIKEAFPLTLLTQGIHHMILSSPAWSGSDQEKIRHAREAEQLFIQLEQQLQQEDFSPWQKRVICERLNTLHYQYLVGLGVPTKQFTPHLNKLKMLTKPPRPEPIKKDKDVEVIQVLKICAWP